MGYELNLIFLFKNIDSTMNHPRITVVQCKLGPGFVHGKTAFLQFFLRKAYIWLMESYYIYKLIWVNSTLLELGLEIVHTSYKK